MNDDNIFEKGEFILAHAVFAILSMFWYKLILLRCIGHCSLTESKMILWILLVLCSAIGIMFQLNYRRTGGSIASNLLSGYGIYTVLTYYRMRPYLIQIVFMIMILLFIIYNVMIFGRRIRNIKRYKKILLRRVTLAIKVTQTILAGGMAVIICCISLNIISDSTVVNASVSTEKMMTDSRTETISNHIEEISKLQDEIWCELSIKEKLNVLQLVANIERCYLGIPNEISVGIANLGEYILGRYLDNTYQVLINVDSLLYDSVEVVLDSLLHEVRHCYQHRLVEVYRHTDDELKELSIWGDAKIYALEFESYEDGKEDYSRYYSQKCETDAREYSEATLNDYYKRVRIYLEEKD